MTNREREKSLLDLGTLQSQLKSSLDILKDLVEHESLYSGSEHYEIDRKRCQTNIEITQRAITEKEAELAKLKSSS